MITYHKGSLFQAPKGSILAHACNCQGVWGSGIAIEFRERFPKSHEAYKDDCAQAKNSIANILGDHLIVPEGDYFVLCLYTSENYGTLVSPPELIVQATRQSLYSFLQRKQMHGGRPIHMPKINSGKFKVPWEKTEEVLNEFKSVDFHIWEP